MTLRIVLFLTCVCLIISLPAVLLAADWYVDGSVPASGNGTSWETAFKTIQEGIDEASNGDAVIVAEGTYVENIQFKGKNIVLRSTDPTNPTVVESTIIDGGRRGSVITFSGAEDETCVLSGFTIRNGSGAPGFYVPEGGGICGGTPDNHTHATIRNNVITGNRANRGGGVAHCDGSIERNTFSENTADYDGGGCSGATARLTGTPSPGTVHWPGLRVQALAGAVCTVAVAQSRTIPSGPTMGYGAGGCFSATARSAATSLLRTHVTNAAAGVSSCAMASWRTIPS